MMYAYLSSDEQLRVRYDARLIFLRTKEFQIEAVHIIIDVKCSNERGHHAWIHHGILNLVHSITDPRRLKGTMTLEMVKIES